MFWLILLIFLLLVLGLLLWLPLQVEINTEKGIYQARWQGIFGFQGIFDEERWRWFFQIFFWEKEWFPGQKKAKANPPKKTSDKKHKSAFSPRQGWFLVKKLLRAMDIKRFRVNWDTGDFVRNAYLYPVFRLTNNGTRYIQINFFGKQELELLLQTRPYRLAMAVLQAFFHSK